MTLLTSHSSQQLWQDVIKNAEAQCAIQLQHELEAYLCSLLMRYTNQPDVTRKVFATLYMKALQFDKHRREVLLQEVGDGCLIFAGLFPRFITTKTLKISYFVDLGRSAYHTISWQANDLYSHLAVEFVNLMDVLQCIQRYPELMPLEAFEQWNDVGSQHAYQVLQQYTHGLPYFTPKR